MTATVTERQEEDTQDMQNKNLDYPQGPVPQTWIVDYPLIAYKLPMPNSNEIAIAHMT